MRNSFFALSLLISISVFASDDKEKSDKKDEAKVEAEMASPTTYVVGIVTRGENWEQDSLKALELQESHVKFLEFLRKQEKLIASGPLTTNMDARGLYIFNVSTIEEATAIMSRDKAIEEGWIRMDFHIWSSRDYSGIKSSSSESKEASSKLDLDINWRAVIGGIFVLFSIILVIRTFRNTDTV